MSHEPMSSLIQKLLDLRVDHVSYSRSKTCESQMKASRKKGGTRKRYVDVCEDDQCDGVMRVFTDYHLYDHNLSIYKLLKDKKLCPELKTQVWCNNSGSLVWEKWKGDVFDLVLKEGVDTVYEQFMKKLSALHEAGVCCGSLKIEHLVYNQKGDKYRLGFINFDRFRLCQKQQVKSRDIDALKLLFLEMAEAVRVIKEKDGDQHLSLYLQKRLKKL